MALRPAMRNVSSELAESFAAGKPIVLAARFSAEAGRASRRQAVDDLLTAADRLADYGVDIRGHLEEPEVLQEMLRAAPAQRSVGANGAEFTNRFVTIDLRPKCGVVVLLSIGSGSKLDGDLGRKVARGAKVGTVRVRTVDPADEGPPRALLGSSGGSGGSSGRSSSQGGAQLLVGPSEAGNCPLRSARGGS
jgi:hypothetical protein